jgi:hypothetical protein
LWKQFDPDPCVFLSETEAQNYIKENTKDGVFYSYRKGRTGSMGTTSPQLDSPSKLQITPHLNNMQVALGLFVTTGLKKHDNVVMLTRLAEIEDLAAKMRRVLVARIDRARGL